ncbi:MAG TPA: hypothetical protein VK609_02430 [Mucilaginibacter sp.]|nr:hypothetical protein [Mucilaginibacter sp.]
MKNRSLPAINNEVALLKKPGFCQAFTKNSSLNMHNPNIYLTLMLSFVFYRFYSRV